MSAIWDAMPMLATTLVFRLLWASLVGSLFVALAWSICRWVPRLSPAARAWIWWLAGAKFLLVLLAVPSIPIPVLPDALLQRLGGPAMQEAIHVASSSPVVLDSITTDPATSESVSLNSRAVDPEGEISYAERFREVAPITLILLWVTGLALGSMSLVQHIARGRRLAGAALPVDDPAVQDLFEELRARYGVTAARLGWLPGSGSPQVRGLAKPIVLMPEATLRSLSRDELAWVLRHELMHLRRRDLWLGLIPLLSARLFFFHPLARIAQREYEAARESACDAAVLGDPDASPRAYGRLLLKLGVRACPPSAAAALVDRKSLKRRLEMLQQLSQMPRVRRSWPFVVLALVALLPLQPVAADATPEPSTQAAPADATHASAAVESGAQRKTAPTPPTPPSAPVAAVAATAPTPPPAPPAEESEPEGRRDLSYVFLKGDHSETSTVWMGGSSRDMEAARAEQRGSEDLFYVRNRNGAWVIRDPELLRQIDAIFQPQRELGAKQAEIGRQQAEIGRQQAEVGASQAEMGQHQAELGRRQAELGRQQAEVAQAQAKLSVELARVELERALTEEGEQEGGPQTSDESKVELRAKLEALSKKQNELAARQRALGDQQRAFGERQRSIGDQQRPLAEQQRPLAEKQRELGEKQRTAAKVARDKLRRLVDRAIADGKAISVQH